MVLYLNLENPGNDEENDNENYSDETNLSLCTCTCQRGEKENEDELDEYSEDEINETGEPLQTADYMQENEQ